VSTGDTDSSNAYFFATVASIWDAVQQSIAKSGVPVEVSASPAEQRATARPKLRLIRGRGTGAISDGKRPVLTVVSG